jgi:hypothetical protein
MTHIAVVELYASELSRLHRAVQWRAACSCGWTGEPVRKKGVAQGEGIAHTRHMNRRRTPCA